MKILLSSLLSFTLMFSSFALAAAPETADLEKQLRQKQDRIDRLEREVESLRNQLMDLQYGAPDGIGNAPAPNRNVADPLVGTWECTNKVYNYDISFFEDGRLVQEEPFFSKVKSGRWSRLDEGRFFIEQGPTFSTDFRSSDELTVTNPTNRAVWDCYRKK